MATYRARIGGRTYFAKARSKSGALDALGLSRYPNAFRVTKVKRGKR